MGGIFGISVRVLEYGRLMLLERYPKEVELKGGKSVTLRPMVRTDEEDLLDFFGGLTDRDRLYLRNDVSNPGLIRDWIKHIDYKRVFPILACAGSRIVGNATLHRKPFGWMRHMGGVRIVISPDYRKHGLARLLAKEIFDNAIDEELEKLTAEVVADQKAVLEVFSKLGFREEAIMRDYVLDAVGNRQNLVIMTRDLI